MDPAVPLISWRRRPTSGVPTILESTDNQPATEEAVCQRILDAMEARQVADFRGLPDAERSIPAEYIQGLIARADSPDAELSCSLRIRGATITGPLRAPSTALRNIALPLQFRDCTFDAPVDLSGAHFLVLRFINCRLPAFIGASLRVSADLDLSGSQFSGVDEYESEISQVTDCAVHINNARIGGDLNMSATAESRFKADSTVRLDRAQVDGEIAFCGALLTGRGDVAVSARSIVARSNVFLESAEGYRCEANGEVVFAAAQITGDLNCRGARLLNPEGRALHCEDLKVETVALVSQDDEFPFEARGRLNFLTAIIDGSFFMSGVRLLPGPDYGGLLERGGPIALNLRQARMPNVMAVNDIGMIADDGEGPATFDAPYVPVRGWFLLSTSQSNALFDNMETGWPEYGFLDLDGTIYTRIRHVGTDPLAEKRLDWLRRQFTNGEPDAESFRPQPYEQLSRVLRQGGLAREANAVAVEKIRMRLASRVDRPWARLFPRLLMLISNHGYSTRRAITSFLAFVLLGTAMYATALFGFGQPFLPVEFDPSPVTYEFAFGLAQHSTTEGCPGLDVMHYALDAALPLIDVSQDMRCRFTPDGPARGLWLLLHSLYVVAGAALSAVVVLTLTGVLRQD